MGGGGNTRQNPELVSEPGAGTHGCWNISGSEALPHLGAVCASYQSLFPQGSRPVG